LVTDIPPSERESRDVLSYAANSYFDALEGDDGKIAALADDCVRHENGYQTVNNPPPGGRMMPAPPLPNPDTSGRATRSLSTSKRASPQCLSLLSTMERAEALHRMRLPEC
jgi:hypothetical protein